MSGLIGRNFERLRTWYEATSRHVEVDGLLADGTNGNGCRLCQARARQLVKASRRAVLAAELETLIDEDSQGGRSQTPLSIMDLRVAAVRAARRELLELAHALRSAERPEARGVALAMLLTRHGQSPLYVEYGADDVNRSRKVRRFQEPKSAPRAG